MTVSQCLRAIFCSGIIWVAAPTIADALDEFHSDESLAQLASQLDEADYKKVESARRKLIRIVNGQGKRGREAKEILDERTRRMDAWLASVGNDIEILQTTSPIVSVRVSIRESTPSHSFKYLLGLTKLRALTLDGEAITDDHIRVLSHMPELGLLHIRNAQVTGASLDGLDLPLEILRLVNCPLTDDGLCKASFPGLRVLDVRGCAITHQTLERVTIPDLLELDIRGTHVDSDGLRQLVRFPKLEKLHVDVEDLSESVIEVIASKLSLRGLDISCSQADFQAAERVRDSLPRKCKVTITVSKGKE